MKEKLRTYMSDLAKEDVAVAFSGGADSSLILKMAVEAAQQTGKNVYAYCIKTTLHPMGEAQQAQKVAEEIGAIYQQIEVDEFSEANIDHNPPDRCYRCKRYMFQRLKQEANKQNVTVIIDGTNEDDMHVYRPGIKALKELGIKSPLAECGCSKQTVRELLAEYHISVANKPSMPCLATRFPYGTKLEREELRRVDEAETYIRNLGCYNVRVRIHQDIARIEVDQKDEAIVLTHRDKIIARLTELGYDYITLDLEGFRSGSMDKKIQAVL